ncbi:hypothetical protein A2276_00595 [candidate division WOR-1 bacterium RIFOXYA12_FULL_43_27]|uniref:Aminomethyltransferase n=1 Tax=candidate division WOR-1 bacterium RIFOXYC2_FULL_46_14 TaxID=1802587 RepID=A0A1F4U4G4_UNCSA|nr:MAG: hypothetical protein A2276_00595 [candidate division WOR-1 bacterium RIFOXYA12_FULL_43_27]OGC20810.1 MAG: hypothetical protein A2292_07280 [candidate division WOR-1 bacterium RIFOXYB2_FULL_46_45]OGC31453.1 MAG: hypothetical protein A2232_04170 [candidate division WOR-1 bacterium RIFOXYA2_FULL_46_56]OGC39858.1 MAG: hypothetical protein A2438_05005 [candidate division WOR-1 bacterium RIFOXYC2_FULL_46_14]
MLKRTPLYDKHLTLKAKMVPFAGWEMPIYYPQGIIAEHKAVRSSCGVFDIGHMGIIKLKGQSAKLKSAELFLNKIGTNDVAKLSDYSCQYSVICNEEGGVVDDILIYKFPDHYIVVANASNTDKVLAWFSSHAEGVEIKLLDDTSMLAIQGQQAESVVVELFGDEEIAKLKRNHCLVLGDITVSRTGYTGEDGFELFVPNKKMAELWDSIIGMKVQPCGLGARDTLRLEAGLPLYGHEYNDKTTPLEAGYSWAVKLGKEFIGRGALLKERKRKLVGIVLEEKNIPREGFKVYNGGTDPIGEVTSGTFSPSLEKPIALAYIYNRETGDKVSLEIRGKRIEGKIVSLPFIKR